MPGSDVEVGRHTADLELVFRAGTLRELFAAAARGMLDYIVPSPARGRLVRKLLRVEAPQREDLLVTWLNELLYRLEVESVKFDRCRFLLFSSRRLEARVEGAVVDLARRGSGVEIKAATYHGLSLFRTASFWEARVIFDL